MHALEGCTEIITYRNINLEALKLKATSSLYMWHLLKLNDKHGKGWVDYTKFLNYLKFIGLNRNHLYNAANNPCSSIFFTINKKANLIEYNGVANISRQLNVKPGTSVLLLFSLVKTLKTFNAYLYATLFANKALSTKMFSREKIEQLTGLSKPTQIAYEKIARIEVEPNMASINIPLKIQNESELVKKFIDKLPCTNKFYSISNGNVYFQLPNSYRCNNVRVCKGKSHRANKIVKLEQVEGMELIPRRAGSTCIFFPYVKPGVVFTDIQDSYIKTSDYTQTSYGKKAILHRYNFMSPTKDYTIAVLNHTIDQYNVIRYHNQPTSTRITEVTI